MKVECTRDEQTDEQDYEVEAGEYHKVTARVEDRNIENLEIFSKYDKNTYMGFEDTEAMRVAAKALITMADFLDEKGLGG